MHVYYSLQDLLLNQLVVGESSHTPLFMSTCPALVVYNWSEFSPNFYNSTHPQPFFLLSFYFIFLLSSHHSLTLYCYLFIVLCGLSSPIRI